MAGHEINIAEGKKQIRIYLTVFGSLAFLTVVTVALSFVDFGSHNTNIAVGLLIATIKASLVAAFFMHLLNERSFIYSVLLLCFFFFFTLLFLPILTSNIEDYPASPLVVKKAPLDKHHGDDHKSEEGH